MKHCPVCRAGFTGKPVCRRCKSDLSVLLQLEERANLSLHLASRTLAAGNLDKAGRLCAHAAKLKKTPFSKALAGFIAFRQNGE